MKKPNTWRIVEEIYGMEIVRPNILIRVRQWINHRRRDQRVKNCPSPF